MIRDSRLRKAALIGGIAEIVLPPYGDESIGGALIAASGVAMTRNTKQVPETVQNDYVHVNSQYLRGERVGAAIRGNATVVKVQQGTNVLPNRSYPQYAANGAYALPGTILYGGDNDYDEMPRRDTQLQRQAMLIGDPEWKMRRDTLIYRSDTTPRRDGGRFRSLPSTVTGPRNSAVFMNGKQGNVYGQ